MENERGVRLMTMKGQRSYGCEWAPLNALVSSGTLEETISKMHTSASSTAQNCGYRFSMRPCIARALIYMHINLRKKNPQWVYNWDMRMDVMRGCFNKKRLLMIHFGLKGRVELQQYNSWYIFYRCIWRKFFSWYIVNSKQVFCGHFSEFEATVISLFRNESTTFYEIWNLVYQLFCMSHLELKCSFLVNWMQHKSHAKKLSVQRFHSCTQSCCGAPVLFYFYLFCEECIRISYFEIRALFQAQYLKPVKSTAFEENMRNCW